MVTGSPRPGTRCSRPPASPARATTALVSVLQPMDPAELRYRADQLARVFTDRGVTYDYAGEERPFPLDLIPRVIDALEWDLVSRGVRQRVKALEAFLEDVYGAGPGVRRRRGPVEPGLHQREVPPRGGRHHPAQRRPGARGRHRPDPRRAGQVPGPRGQRAGAERRQLRDREPAGDDQDVPRPLRRPAHPPRRGVPVAAAQRAQSGRPAGRGRPVRGRAHPRRAQRRLLRAHPARPADGDRAGRGARPVLLAQPGLRAHHPRPPPGRRHLPPGRRRLARPAALPARLRPRLPRPAQRGQARHGDGRQRRRQRRRRR